MRPTRKKAVLALALVLPAVLSACAVKPAEVPLEDRITYVQPPEPQSQPRPAQAASSVPKAGISRPSVPVYELLSFDETGVTGMDGRKLVLEALPEDEAATVVCSALSAEVTGEFWRWQTLCQKPLREPALAMPWLDALEEGYLGGYGYQRITVHQVYTLSAEQMRTALDGRGENPILWPYFLKAGNQASYEANVDDFWAQGDRLVYLDCTLEFTEAQDADTQRHTVWYYLKPTGGHLWIVNNTLNTDGRFIA